MILIMIPIMILVCNLRLRTVYICIVSNIMHHIESFVSFLVLLSFYDYTDILCLISAAIIVKRLVE